ncbi:MAG TPA: membrane protein insertase YidC [Flavisolibacter sp.]
MNFDRNTIIGFIILAVLFFGFFYYNNQQQAALSKQRAQEDSARAAQQPVKTKIDTTVAVRTDTVVQPVADTLFGQTATGTEQIAVYENKVIKVAFTNRGGQPKWVELKDYKNADSSNIRLAATDFDGINYRVAATPQKTVEAATLYFQPAAVQKAADGTQTISYSVHTPDGRSLTHRFVIRPDNYMIDFDMQVKGAATLLQDNTISLTWQRRAMQLQKDLNYEKQQSAIGYRVDGDYDYTSAVSSDQEEFSKPVNWVSVKQQFFNTTLIAKNNFSSARIEWVAPSDTDQHTVVQATAVLKLRVPQDESAIPLALYYGPTDYKTLKQYGNDMEDMVNLGSGIFAFVKYINRWIVIPLFDLFATYTMNYGIVILLLTLAIRLLISPLTYSSYLSGAKMKVLRPEIEQLKAKYGGDQQQISMEQMKLFREAGVNPLGGCIPGLLQIPIFFALYSFFNASVALRGKSFLWASDLSQSDSILDFGYVPVINWIYGDHVSLFTILAVVTSFLISIYSMSMAPDQNNPVLKYMPYFFPIILLFIFNKLPSGLTWYYTVSNVITLALQFVIQNYIIDHDKLLARLQANRLKPKTKSKWQERFEQMQEQQKKMQESQKKNR